MFGRPAGLLVLIGWLVGRSMAPNGVLVFTWHTVPRQNIRPQQLADSPDKVYGLKAQEM